MVRDSSQFTPNLGSFNLSTSLALLPQMAGWPSAALSMCRSASDRDRNRSSADLRRFVVISQYCSPTSSFSARDRAGSSIGEYSNALIEPVRGDFQIRSDRRPPGHYTHFGVTSGPAVTREQSSAHSSGRKAAYPATWIPLQWDLRLAPNLKRTQIERRLR